MPENLTSPQAPESRRAPAPSIANRSARKNPTQDFRDHLATADDQGRRRWIYAKKITGKWTRWRTRVSWVLLALMFTGPFIRIHGNPLLLINIVDRRFCILGKIFWPQDVALFAVAMLVFIMGIMIFTTAFGRIWCGWTCPQTLLMEMVFRKIEWAIEGGPAAQRALNAAPWSARKILIKLGKHSIFFGLSFVIGNTLLSYIIGSERLLQIITDPPLNHIAGLTFMILFTLLFYAIFARFREQACTFICPYGRYQSAALDENTLVVAYDYKRGEKRGPLRRAQTFDLRKSAGFGDCISCSQCVSVCPTGIDIRDGTQMECVNCTACIDACDTVMDKVGKPRGLIRFASLNNIERGERQRFTPRMAGYSVVLATLISLFLFLLFTRSDVQTTLLRAPGALFQQVPNGDIQNIYTLKLLNKTSHDIPVELRLENIAGTLSVMSGNLIVPKENLAQTSVLIALNPQLLHGAGTKIKVGVYSNGKRLETLNTVFAGPRPIPQPN